MDQKESMDAVMRRIEKLLAMARDTRGNANESAAAAAMAARVMLKYQLSEADVLVASLKRGDDLCDEIHIPTLAEWKDPLKRVPRWASLLAAKIADLTETKAVISSTVTPKGREMCIRFMGFCPDVRLAIYTIQYLQGEIRRHRTEFLDTYTYKVKGFTALRSYTDGLTIGICTTLQDEIDKRAEEAKASSAGTSLVIAKSTAIAERYGEIEKGKKVTLTVRDGFDQGVEDGKAISVAKPLEAPDSSQLSLPATKG